MSSKCHRRKKRRKTTTKRPFDLFHFQVLHFYYYSAFVYVWNYNNVLALVSQLNWIMQCSAVRRKLRNFAQKIMRTTFFNLLSWLSCTTRVTASHKRLNHLRISLELRSRWATSKYILRSRRKFMESTDKASVEHCQDKYRDFSTIYNGPQHPQTVKNGMASNRKTCRWRQQKPFRNIRFSCWRKTESISSHTFLFPFCSLSIFCTIMQLWRRHSARSSTQNLCGRNMFFFLFFSVDESQRTLWLRRPPAHTNSQRRAYIYIGSFVFGACIHSNMTYACRTLFFVSLCVLFGWHICVSGDLCPLHMWYFSRICIHNGDIIGFSSTNIIYKHALWQTRAFVISEHAKRNHNFRNLTKPNVKSIRLSTVAVAAADCRNSIWLPSRLHHPMLSSTKSAEWAIHPVVMKICVWIKASVGSMNSSAHTAYVCSWCDCDWKLKLNAIPLRCARVYVWLCVGEMTLIHSRPSRASALLSLLSCTPPTLKLHLKRDNFYIQIEATHTSLKWNKLMAHDSTGRLYTLYSYSVRMRLLNCPDFVCIIQFCGAHLNHNLRYFFLPQTSLCMLASLLSFADNNGNCESRDDDSSERETEPMPRKTLSATDSSQAHRQPFNWIQPDMTDKKYVLTIRRHRNIQRPDETPHRGAVCSEQ